MLRSCNIVRMSLGPSTMLLDPRVKCVALDGKLNQVWKEPTFNASGSHRTSRVSDQRGRRSSAAPKNLGIDGNVCGIKRFFKCGKEESVCAKSENVTPGGSRRALKWRSTRDESCEMSGNGCTQPRCKTSILGKGAFAIRAESAEAKTLRDLRARRGLENIL